MTLVRKSHATAARPSLLAAVHALFAESAALACKQTRSAAQLERLSYGLILNLGRQTMTQTLVALGEGETPPSASYDLFHEPRISIEQLRTTLVHQVLGPMGRHRPVVVVLDSTQLPRAGKEMPGVGWTKALASPPWKPGLMRAQRWEGLSLLLPRSSAGETRAVPLWFEPAPTPKATPWCEHLPRTEWEAGRDALWWLRGQLVDVDQRHREILAIADGSYAVAPLLRELPYQTTLLARCAKNRALFALPTPPEPGTRGRPRCYGAHGPRPSDLLHDRRQRWRTATVTIRSRRIPLTYCVTGPWLIKSAPGQPLFLLVVKGIRKIRHGRELVRDPTYWIVTAKKHGNGWVLPFTPQSLLAWAWQRWEVEVMHRELKSGFGLGQQQAWSDTGAAVTTQWVVWSYATLLVAGYHTWGWEHQSAQTAWDHRRRWTPRDVVTSIRREVWSTLGTAIRASLPEMPAHRAIIPPLSLPPPRDLASSRRL